MNIAKIETYPLLHRLAKPYGDANGYKKYRSCYLIKVTTSSGVQGWGECIDWLPTLEKGFKERIIPFLLHKDIRERTKLVQTIKKWHSRAATAVSMALTEILAKQANLSICDLWGAKWREQVPVYASFQSYTEEENWIDHSIQSIEEQVSLGIKAIKVKIGGKSLHEDQKHIEQVFNLVDSDILVGLDANQSYDLASTKAWRKIIDSHSNILWFEEPMPLACVEEYRVLRSFFSCPLAGGENFVSTAAFLPLVEKKALDIMQPDVMHMEGIEEYRHTLQLARTMGLRVSAHVFDGALSRYYAILAQACLSPWSKMDEDEIEPVEWDVMENPFSKLIHLKPNHGIVTIPTGIGTGLELDTELIQYYLWDGSSYY